MLRGCCSNGRILAQGCLSKVAPRRRWLLEGDARLHRRMLLHAALTVLLHVPLWVLLPGLCSMTLSRHLLGLLLPCSRRKQVRAPELTCAAEDVISLGPFHIKELTKGMRAFAGGSAHLV